MAKAGKEPGSSEPEAARKGGGESAAHLRLKRRALVWARCHDYRFAAAEVRVPSSGYRADVGACRKGRGEEPGPTALFECKQSRADFLSDSKRHAESLAKLKKLRKRETKLEKLVGDHLPSLRVADSLFPEYRTLDVSGLDHKGLHKLRREIAVLERAIFGRTKFDKMVRWNCADLLYLVTVPGVVDLDEVPSHWGVLVEPDPEAPDGPEALLLQRSPVLLQPGRAGRLRLLESIAARATQESARRLGVEAGRRGRGFFLEQEPPPPKVGAMNIVALFAGQGAQHVGMGQDLVAHSAAARVLYEKADQVLGYEFSRLCFEGPAEELTATAVCQPALYVHGLAALAALREQNPAIKLVAAAGLSLGELTAHAAAGTYSFEDGLRLVADRGRFMQEACDATKGGMAAVIGGTGEAVEEIAAACDLDVANFNAPGQTVLSGAVEGIEKAVAMAKEHAEVRMAKPLEVAGAYHSRLMISAQEKLAARLAETELAAPAFPVVCNVDATEAVSADEIRDTLARQVTGSVRWVEAMQELIADFPDARFLEFGPKGTIKGLARRIDGDLEVAVVEDAATLLELA